MAPRSSVNIDLDGRIARASRATSNFHGVLAHFSALHLAGDPASPREGQHGRRGPGAGPLLSEYAYQEDPRSEMARV